jgi:hypothetical protein
MAKREGTLPVWVGAVAAALFLVHAANYLYFFVDDEAIPYVYAQNVLHGKGLSYNVLEGRVEGYSDFLHVGLSTLILAVTHVARLPKISVFFVGKALSLLGGLAIVLMIWEILRRSRTDLAGAVAGLGALALAGPLALWSCSSLEAIPFALMTTMLIAALAFEWDGWAAAAAALLILERIDGFVYVGVLVGAFLFTAAAARRREMLRRIVVPVSVVFGIYHGWRWVYFRDFVPAPLEAKILYKLIRHSNLMVKAPDNSYLSRFISVYGWPAALALAAAGVQALRIGGLARRLTLAALPLVVYVALVGDWMFGFRFFVPLLPLFALIVAASVGHIAVTRPRLAAGLCLISLMYAGIAAVRFFNTYAQAENTQSFLHSPSRNLHRFFWPYYGLYETARRLMPTGEVVAYNQAGFVPFMLDVNNIDDLGICSRFHADVPTTDLYFTEVGRYAPLTNKRTLRPAEAYLLYQNVRFVMARTDILARANHDAVPQALFGGYYNLVGTDAERLNAIYRRSERSADEFAIDPRLFAENVAHVSYLRDVHVDGVRVDPANYIRLLPFLHDDEGPMIFTGRLELILDFAARDEPLNGISVEGIHVNQPAALQIRLIGQDGGLVKRDIVPLEPNRVRSIRIDTPGAAASQLSIDLTAAPGVSGKVWINDLRVQGQRPALEAYIVSHLRFPRDPAPRR